MAPRTTIANDLVHLELAPDFGGRVTRLVDLTSGRDWLVPGACEGGAGDEAAYGGLQARGWDECFPTVAPCIASPRDHGEIWGRPVACEVAKDGILTSYAGNGYRFDRQLVLEGGIVFADYKVTNISKNPISFLYSQHCLLNLTENDRIGLSGVGQFNVTGVLGQTAPLPDAFHWPRFDDAHADLAIVEPMSVAWAMKAYAPAIDQVTAWVDGPTSGIRFDWSDADIGTLGLWLDYGGWPDGKPAHQVAFEPTTAPADDLNSAMNQKQERWIVPNETAAWSVKISLTHQIDRSSNYEQ